MKTIWMVTAEFDNSDDANALLELMRDLGISAHLSYRTLNTKKLPMSQTRLGRIVLAYMRPGKRYDIAEIADHIESLHYAPTSASVALSQMAREGKLVSDMRGEYRLAADTIDHEGSNSQ